MSDCYAFGSASQLDIVRNNCTYGSAQQGFYFVGLAVDITNTLNDAFSMKLTSPLIAGHTYTLSFYNRKDSAYNSNQIEIGYSADSLTFGTPIGTATALTTTWVMSSFTFTPAFNCQFITVRTIVGSYGWNFVDDFAITETTGLTESDPSTYALQIFPNPTSGFISIISDKSYNIISASIKDIRGKTVLASEDHTLDLTALNHGIYLIEIFTNKGLIIKRIIRD